MFVIRPLDTDKKNELSDPIWQQKENLIHDDFNKNNRTKDIPKTSREILLGPRLRLLLGDAWTRTRRHGRLFSGYIGSSRWPDLGAPKTALVTPPLAGARNVSQMIVL